MPSLRLHSNRRRAGMMLLEALAALAVFSIAAVGLARALSAAAGFAKEARMVAEATRVMENALEEALHRPVFEPGEWVDDSDPGGIVVTTAIREAEMENGDGQVLNGLYEVEVTGTLRRGNGEEFAWTLRTLCYPPLYAGTR